MDFFLLRESYILYTQVIGYHRFMGSSNYSVQSNRNIKRRRYDIAHTIATVNMLGHVDISIAAMNHVGIVECLS